MSFRQGYATAVAVNVKPSHVPVWTGPMQMLKHRFDKEIAALREDAWMAYLKEHADIAVGDMNVHADVRALFMSAFNTGSIEAAARVLSIIAYEDGILPRPVDAQGISGLSFEATERICDEFGLERQKGRHTR